MIMRTEAAENHSYHSCRDCYGRAMAKGSYMMTRPGSKPVKVEVIEDDISGDLSILTEAEGSQVNQRVEDCAADVTFSRISASACEAERKLEAIRQILQGADEARKDLDAFEAELAAVMCCGVGDGTMISDAVMAAVRDGNGTPYQLLQQLAEA
jgi:hypothetical protein